MSVFLSVAAKAWTDMVIHVDRVDPLMTEGV